MGRFRIGREMKEEGGFPSRRANGKEVAESLLDTEATFSQ